MRLLLPTVILASALFLGGCVWVPKAPVTQLPTDSAPTSTTTIDTSDWKTYTNEEYGFSFRYPGEWGEITFTQYYNNPKSVIKDFYIVDNGDSQPYQGLSVYIHDFGNASETNTDPYYSGENYPDRPPMFGITKNEIRDQIEEIQEHPETRAIDNLLILDKGEDSFRYDIFEGIFVKTIYLVSGRNYIEFAYMIPTTFVFPAPEQATMSQIKRNAGFEKIEGIRKGDLLPEERNGLLLFDAIINSIQSSNNTQNK